MEEYTRDSFRAIREQMESGNRQKRGSVVVTLVIILIFMFAGVFYVKTAQPQLYTKAVTYIKSIAAKAGSLETISNALFNKVSDTTDGDEKQDTENTAGESGDMLLTADNLSFNYVSQPLQFTTLSTKKAESAIPVMGATVTSSFGQRTDPVTGEGEAGHHGIDLAASPGSKITAFMSGTVIEVGKSAVYGNYVIIDHGASLTTFYGHLSRVSVKEGDSVSCGDKIGIIGSTGKSTGVHLHFEVRVNNERVDPAPYLYEKI